ncbi:MAG: HNH endonuclease, partial [Alphaproteobacteria bacterium]|nr:HNH endonuclease [Alphaproteobacteria bacterium]
CQYCNLAKGSRLPNECDMHPRTPPQQPTSFTLQKQGRKFPHKHLHESWMDFLYWDSELDSQT